MYVEVQMQLLLYHVMCSLEVDLSKELTATSEPVIEHQVEEQVLLAFNNDVVFVSLTNLPGVKLCVGC